MRPLLSTRHAALSRGAKFEYVTGHSGRCSSKNVLVAGLRNFAVPIVSGDGLNSHRRPGVTVSRGEICHVSCTHSESSLTSVDALTAGDKPNQSVRLSVSVVMSSAIALCTSDASRRIGTIRRKSAPRRNACAPRVSPVDSTNWSCRCRRSPSLPLTTCPTPPIENRTSESHGVELGNRYDVNGARSQPPGPATPAPIRAHVDCASDCDALARRSTVSLAVGRTLSPSVRLRKCKSSRLTSVLPNSLEEGDSL